MPASAHFLLQAVTAELAGVRQSLETAKEEAAAKSKEIEELHRQLEASTSQALVERQATAALDIDLANALDRLATQTSMAVSVTETADMREAALTEEIANLKQEHAKEVSHY